MFVEKSQKYISDVLDGTIPACELIQLACRRSQRDHARQDDPAWPFRFDIEKAERACKFISLLTHTQGPLSSTRIILEPWQSWLLTEMFGWVWKNTGTRRFRRGYLEIPRGNGKSVLAAAITLYLAFADGEGGADCVATASNMDQARIILDTSRRMVSKDPVLARKFGLEVLAHRIEQTRSNSRLRGLPSKASSLEGISLHAGVLDELHLAKSRAVFDSLRTATSKRSQALLFATTTAGNDIAGVCYEVHCYVESILHEEKHDESFFGAVYTIDVGDDWTQESSWRKANPNWNVSVDAQGLREEANRAMLLPSNEEAFKTKHLDVWVGSFGETPFLDLQKVRACNQAALKDDLGGECCIGVDLASRLDLTACVRLHAKRVDNALHYFAFCDAWLPSETIRKAQNASYGGWIRQGWLHETPGDIVDLSYVEEHLANELKRNVRHIFYDPLQSNLLVSRLSKQFPDLATKFVEFTQSGKFYTSGMLLLEELVAAGRLHTSSPLLLWCLSNLRCKKSLTHLLFPVRPKDVAQKIDAAVGLIMGLSSCANVPLDESTEFVYNGRGIDFI